MNRKFITNLILLVGLNLLVKPFYLVVVEAEIQNRVGADEFGSYFALLNFSFILNILLDMGTTNWNTRQVARGEQVFSGQLSGMIGLRLMTAFAYLLLSLAIGWWLNYSGWQMWLLMVLAFNQVLASGALFFRSYLTGLHLFRHDSVISVLDRLILLIAMSLLLWGGITGSRAFRVEWLVYGQTGAYFITLLTALVMVLRKTDKIKLTFDKSFSLKILKESAPFAVMSFLTMVAYRVDGVMLERMDSPTQAGIYAMCYRLFEAVNMIAYLFAVLLYPMFSRMLKRNESVSELLQLSFKVMFSGVFIVGALSYFYGDYLLSLIYDHNIAEATPVFTWLMASVICFSLQYIFGTLITASGDLRPLIIIALGAMVYNVLLNTFYIPQMGSLGAAKASFFTQLMILIAQIVVARERFVIGSFGLTTVRAGLFALACVGIGYFFSTQTIFELSIPYYIGLFAASCLLMATATRMLDLKALLEIVKARE